MSSFDGLTENLDIKDYFSSLDLSKEDIEKRERIFLEILPFLDHFYERKVEFEGDTFLLGEGSTLLKDIDERATEVEIDFE